MTDWGEIYAHLIACTGWTWDYIAENVDLLRLETLNRYWDKFPPLHVMVAAYLGLKPQESKTTNECAGLDDQDAVPVQRMSEEEFNQLLKSKGLMQ